MSPTTKSPTNYTYLTIKTSGSKPHRDRIIQISWLKEISGNTTETFSTWIDPGSYLSIENLQLLGIGRAQLLGKPSFPQIAKQLISVLDNSLVVTTNAHLVRLFLKSEFARFGVSFNLKLICLSTLIDQSEGLPDIQRLKRKIKGTTVVDSLEYLQTLQEEFTSIRSTSPQTLEQVLTLSKKPTLPNLTILNFIKTVPNTPGVYLFYGENDVLLYVGKSVTLKNRILSHFSNSHLNATDNRLALNTVRLEIRPTAGELGALLLESTLVKKLKPLYNRALRFSQGLIVLKYKLNEKGYYQVFSEKASTQPSFKFTEVIGLFKNQGQVFNFLKNLAKEASLCEKMLGIEKTNSACFNYRLGFCRGVCVGKETNSAYNQRFRESLEQFLFKPWPYQGTTIIEEKSADGKLREWFYVDKWCFVRKVSFKNGQKVTDISTEIGFDLDSYKILNSYLTNPANQSSILPAVKVKEVVSS